MDKKLNDKPASHPKLDLGSTQFQSHLLKIVINQFQIKTTLKFHTKDTIESNPVIWDAKCKKLNDKYQ
jgi:hypothetical protein